MDECVFFVQYKIEPLRNACALCVTSIVKPTLGLDPAEQLQRVLSYILQVTGVFFQKLFTQLVF